MTLDDWRRLSALRPELSMTPLGPPPAAKAKASTLTGMGGGWKEAEGWKCQSFHCVEFLNKRHDTQCKRCGAARRF